MRIANNVPALSAFNSLNSANNNLQKVIKQVSTGLRINSAADDAAGLAISENMRAQSTGLERSIKNAQDGISLLQTAEGALGETNSMLQRMRELAVQAANDTLTTQDRSYLQMEIDELKAQIDRISDTTQFNTKRLLDGSCCGTCSSTEMTTKGYIKGAIDIEGNYKIQVNAKPGQAQVQKSAIFKVCNENVITNEMTDNYNGIKGLEINNLPAGDFQVTASMGAGGEVYYHYDGTIEGQVTEANTTGLAETMPFTFKYNAKTEDGVEEQEFNFNVELAAEDNTPEKIAQKIVDKVNEIGKLTIDEEEVTLSAVLGEDGKYTIKTSGLREVTGFESGTPSVSASTKIDNATNTSDPETWSSFYIPNTVSSYEEPTITYGSHEKKLTGTTWTSASQALNDIKNTLSEFGISDSYVTAYNTSDGSIHTSGGNTLTSSNGYMLWIAANGETTGIKGTSEGGSSSPYATRNQQQYKINSEWSFSQGNISTEDETLTFRIGNYSGSPTSISVTIPAGTEKENIPGLIKTALEEKFPNLTLEQPTGYNSETRDIKFTFTDNGDGSFSIKSESPNVWKRQITFSGSVSSSITATGKTENSVSSDPKPMSDAGGVATLTGAYGIDAENAFNIAVEGTSGKVENNANILFEVTDKNYNSQTGEGTITLSARSYVMGVDGSTSNYSESKIFLSTARPSINLGALLGENEDHVSLSLKDGFDINQIQTGNKFVYNICGVGEILGTSADTSLFVTGQQDSKWPLSWDDENNGIMYHNNSLQYNINAEVVSNKDLHFRNFYLSSDTGEVYEGDIKLRTDDNFKDAAAKFDNNKLSMSSFTSNYVGKVADGNTKLRDLDQFYNKSGVFMLENPQKITITQNDGKKAQVSLYADDTLNSVAKKLNDAIANDLGQGVYVKGGDANKIVTFVETPTEGTGFETVEGTFLIRSLIPGEAGELTFSSSYGELIDNLGLNTVQHSEEGYYNVSVSNAHNGEIIASNVKTTGNLLQGVIKNVDVEFDPMAGVSAVWSEDDKNFILTPENEPYTTYLHVVKNDISFHTGANEGEKIRIDIGDMSSAALGIEGLNILTNSRAEKAITTLDNAIKEISAQRSKIGAYENALEHTIENLTLSNTNLIESESRIRDADMSKSMLDLVKYQIIHQSGTSMLAQANQLPQSVLNLIQ